MTLFLCGAYFFFLFQYSDAVRVVPEIEVLRMVSQVTLSITSVIEAPLLCINLITKLCIGARNPKV